MRISDWSSDVCSSDLEAGMSGARETLSLAAAEALVVQVLTAAGTSADNAKSVAAALIAAEADGQSGHGLSRVAAYAGRSEEHTSELQSLMRISYAVFCLKKKKTTKYATRMQYKLSHTRQTHSHM